jgi:kynureninase
VRRRDPEPLLHLTVAKPVPPPRPTVPGGDAAWEPGAWRHRFEVTDPDLVYVDGNSLGRMPATVPDLARDLVGRQWADRLIRGWNDGWFDLPTRIGDKIGLLLGARPGEVVVADSTTVNLHRLVGAALLARPDRPRVVTDDLNFPSDHHALAATAAAHGRSLEIVPSDGVHGPVEDLEATLDTGVAVLSLSATAYRSGYTYDLDRLTAAAHGVGALVVWDLSHTAGSVPVDLAATGVDLAVGCSYKYLNGGPGAPAWSFVRHDLQELLENPLAGWMGAADVFSFSPTHTPASGIRRFLTGTPAVVSTALIEPGVDLLLEVGMETLRAASLTLTDRLLQRFDDDLAPRGMGLASPRDPAVRGGHLTFTHPEALALDLALIERGIIPDFRPPDGIRVGPAPLYVTLDDVDRVADALIDLLDSGDHRPHLERDVVVT